MNSRDYIKSLSNSELHTQCCGLIHRERKTTVSFLKYLAEVGIRKLYMEMAYGSLFSYCTQGLRLSEGATYRRLSAARLMFLYPEVEQMLLSGELYLSRMKIPDLKTEPPSRDRYLILCFLSEGYPFAIQSIVILRKFSTAMGIFVYCYRALGN